MISCVIGQIKSTGTSFLLDAKAKSIDLAPAKWLSTVNVFVKSQIKSVRSFEPDTKTVESKFTVMQLTYLECSASVFTQFPCMSQILIVLSKLHDSKSVPVELNLQWKNDSSERFHFEANKSWLKFSLDTGYGTSMCRIGQHTFCVHCRCTNDCRVTT